MVAHSAGNWAAQLVATKAAQLAATKAASKAANLADLTGDWLVELKVALTVVSMAERLVA